VWMSSPAPILRVAKTPRPAESVKPTRIGRRLGWLLSSSWLVVVVVVEKERENLASGLVTERRSVN